MAQVKSKCEERKGSWDTGRLGRWKREPVLCLLLAWPCWKQSQTGEGKQTFQSLRSISLVSESATVFFCRALHSLKSGVSLLAAPCNPKRHVGENSIPPTYIETYSGPGPVLRHEDTGTTCQQLTSPSCHMDGMRSSMRNAQTWVGVIHSIHFWETSGLRKGQQ